jgi:hypothetical protein
VRVVCRLSALAICCARRSMSLTRRRNDEDDDYAFDATNSRTALAMIALPQRSPGRMALLCCNGWMRAESLPHRHCLS